MTKLRVIPGFKKEEVRINYHRLYSTAFINVLKNASERFDGFDDYDLDTKRKMIWSGVKMVNFMEYEGSDYDSLHNIFHIISSINAMIGRLTPRELQTVFPITKEYDGEKYQTKDYFYTKDFIEEFGMDKVIGEEAARFHWNYDNANLRLFSVQSMGVMSEIRRAEGGKGIMEEFLEEQGVTTYTEVEDEKGRKFLRNNDTDEMVRIRKPRPRHLKVVK